jgi:hypothetical protein
MMGISKEQRERLEEVGHTGECREAMSGPTCFNPACPPCQTVTADDLSENYVQESYEEEK